jgi:hypothetical protein
MKFERVVDIKEYSWPRSVRFHYPDFRKSMNDRIFGYMMKQTTIDVGCMYVFTESERTQILGEFHADTAQYDNATCTSPIGLVRPTC